MLQHVRQRRLRVDIKRRAQEAVRFVESKSKQRRAEIAHEADGQGWLGLDRIQRVCQCYG